MKGNESKESSIKKIDSKTPSVNASVKEVKKFITPKDVKNQLADGYYKHSRFNKQKFNWLMRAMLNDPDFVETSVKYYHQNLQPVDLSVSKDFRKFIKRVLEKLGVDSSEAKRILEPEFKFDNVNGLYEFFASAVYEYMEVGNKFDLIPKEDFRATIYMDTEKKKKKKYKARDPISGTYLGEVEVETEEHKRLKVSSPAPKWMTKRKKITK